MRSLNFCFFLSTILLTVCFSCKPGQKNSEQLKTVTQIVNPTKEVIIENLKRPWSMAFLSDDEALVAEKDGDPL